MSSTIHKIIYNKAVSITETSIEASEFGSTKITKNIQLLIKAIQCTGKKKYIPILCTLADNLIEQTNSFNTKDYSLYKGRMGTVYALIQVSKIVNETKYLNHALEIAESCNAEFLHSDEITNSLYIGRAGTLLTLLHLYDATHKKWILAYIKTYAEKIIKKAIVTNKGSYWDHSAQNVKGLCDFAEGTNGIAFVFRELGEYFNNKAFNTVADWATDYENAQWSSECQNWPNYKKKITSKEELFYYIEAYKSKKQKIFSSNYNDFSLKHGSSGIILGAQKSSNSQQLANINMIAKKIAFENIIYENDEQFFGKIRTLFYAGDKLKNNDYKEKACALLLDQIKNIKDYITLGILCFELSNETVTPSLYNPFIKRNHSEEHTINLDNVQVKKLLLEKAFPKSLKYLSIIAPKELETFFTKRTTITDFKNILYSKHPKIATFEDPKMQMEVLLEKEQFEMFTSNRNYVFNWIEKIVMQHYFSEAYAANETAVFNRELILNTDKISIVKISNQEDIDITDNREYGIESFISYGMDSFMLQITNNGNIHRTSLQMIKLIYASFFKKNTIQKVGDELLQFLSCQSPHVIQGVRKTLFMSNDENFEVGLRKALTKITVDLAYNGILKPADKKLWV